MSYAAARMTVQSHKVQTAAAYLKWWDEIQPIAIPRFPYRVYIEEWKSWNDFLGNNNVWISKNNKNIQYITYFEALKWTQKQGWKVKDQFITAHRQGKIPKDIPKRPDNFYKEWVNWPVFLGAKIQDKIAGAKINVAILAVCVPIGYPGGHLQFIFAPNGEPDLNAKLLNEGSPQVVKLYQWEPEKISWLTQTISNVGTEREKGIWLVSNAHYVIAELDQTLMWHRR